MPESDKMPRSRGRVAYWDYPDSVLEADADPFAIFAHNESELMGWREGGMYELAATQQESWDREYREWHHILVADFFAEDPTERTQPLYLRLNYPALMFWGNGDLLARNDPEGS